MAFRSSATSKSDTGGDLTATPLGNAANDYLSGWYAQDASAATPTYPSGWTERANCDLTADTQTVRYADKVAAGGDSFTFATANAGNNILICMAHSGRNTSAPRTFLTATKQNTAQNSVISAGATGGTSVAGDDLIAYFATDQQGGSDVWTYDPPTSPVTFIERADDHTSNWASAAGNSYDNFSGGATGNITSNITRTAGSSNAGWAAVIVSVAAAPASGVTFDAASNSGDIAAANNYSGSVSWSGSNRMLSIDVTMLGPGVTVTAMTYGGANCTFIGSKATVTSFGSVECWRILQSDAGAPGTGSNILSVTLSGSIEFSVEWVSYTTVDQLLPTEAFNSAQATNVGSATDASVTITSVTNNCWIHSACVANDTSITPNQTSRNNVSGTLGSGVNEDNNAAVNPAGATTMSVTGMGITTTWAIAGYAIKPFIGEENGIVFITLVRTAGLIGHF